MNKVLSEIDLNLLGSAGWTVQSKLPVIIKHDDGSVASGLAITIILNSINIIGTEVVVYNSAKFKSFSSAKNNHKIFKTNVIIRSGSFDEISTLLDIIQNISLTSCDVFKSSSKMAAGIIMNGSFLSLSDLFKK